MKKTRVAIIGGGITGLAAAVWLERDHGIDDVLVVEAAGTAGGKIRSKIDAGSTLEEGPQGFLDNAPDTLELASIVGLEDALVQADESDGRSFHPPRRPVAAGRHLPARLHDVGHSPPHWPVAAAR